MSLCSFPQLSVAFSDVVPVWARSKWHQRRRMATLVPKLYWQQNKMVTWWHLLVLSSIYNANVCVRARIHLNSFNNSSLRLLCFDISVGPQSRKMNLSLVLWTQTESMLNCSRSKGNSDIWGQWGGGIISQGSVVPLTCVLAVQIFGRPGSLSKNLHANWWLLDPPQCHVLPEV